MQTSHISPVARDDTLLGVCEALGEDFGFNPIYLRLALAVSLLWNPVVVIGGYVAVAAVVAVSRWLAPNPRPADLPAEWSPAAAPQAAAEQDREPLPIAA